MNKVDNKAEKFLERYREAEEWVINNLNIPDIKELEFIPKYKSLKSRLTFCRSLRNLLSHQDWSKGGEDLIIVTDQAIKMVNSIYYTLNPFTLKRIAIPINRIFSASFSDSVLKTMQVMNDNDYSFVPILEDCVVKGVFSAKALMKFITENGNKYDLDSLIFNQIKNYIAIDIQGRSKIGFISLDHTLEDAEMKFSGNKFNNNRLDLLLITENGQSDGKLIGILTPSDLLRY